MTLLVIGILAVLVLEFSYLMRVEARGAGNYLRNIQALYLAKGGVNLAIALLGEEGKVEEGNKIIPEWPYSGSVLLGKGRINLEVIAESGKINVNRLKDKEGKLIRNRVDQLLRLCDLLNEQYASPLIGYGIVPAMVDWVDADNKVESFNFIYRENKGAEEAYYQSLPHPYHCENRPFATVGELGLVRGVSAEVLYGRKAREKEGIKATAGLAKYVTVYGEGKININTAPLKVIRSLDERIDKTLAQNILAYREEKPFREVSELKAVKGMSVEIYKSVEGSVTTKKSVFFSVKSEGIIGKSKREIKAVIKRDGGIVYWRVE